MATFLKFLLVALFALVIFAKEVFPSQILYWCTYVVMFALIPLWWLAAFYVSEKKAKTLVKGKIKASFQVGMVTANVGDDLARGRLCITAKDIILVGKDGSKYKVIWKESKENITYTSTGKVAGVRNGFTLCTKNEETSFVSKKGEEIIKVITE